MIRKGRPQGRTAGEHDRVPSRPLAPGPAGAVPEPIRAHEPPRPAGEPLRILLLEDSAPHAELVDHHLRAGGLEFRLQRVETQDRFESALTENPPGLILSDYALPSFDGYTALGIAKQKCPDVPFIFVTGTMGEEVAIETLKSGATDYVLKTRLSRLVPAVQRALREAAQRREHARAEERLRQSHEQLRALTAYLQHVREEERTRIAREVHDELGGALTGLKLDLSWLNTRLPREVRAARQKLKSMSAHVDATIQTVRRIATELRPGILDNLGLAAAIEWQANEFQVRTGIACTVTSTVRETMWDQKITTVFFRIFQETLTNIIRHAKATRVDAQLREEAGHLVLIVHDNGRGISDAEISSTRTIGLTGMRERAALLGGEVCFTGAPGKGTTVTVRVPIPNGED